MKGWFVIAVSPTMKFESAAHVCTFTHRQALERLVGKRGGVRSIQTKKRMCVCERERLKGLTKRLSIPPDDALVLSEVI